MKTNRYALITIATLAAALSAAPAFAKAGKFDPYADGARQGKFEVFSEGAKSGKFDTFVNGAKSGRYDTFSDGARYDATSDRMPL